MVDTSHCLTVEGSYILHYEVIIITATFIENYIGLTSSEHIFCKNIAGL